MNRVAVVTGGTRGIGAAISKALAASGYSVRAIYHGNDEAAARFHAATGVNVYKWDVASFRSLRGGPSASESRTSGRLTSLSTTPESPATPCFTR